MARSLNRDLIDFNDDVSRVTLNEVERTALNRRRFTLENELRSLREMLDEPEMGERVPNIVNDHMSAASAPPCFHQLPRDSISSSDSPFYGFANISSPHFRHFAAGDTNIWIPNESVRGNLATLASLQQQPNVNLMPQQSNQHLPRNLETNQVNIPQHEANVITTEADIITTRNRSHTSNRLMGLRSIDEWVEDVCEHNVRENSIRDSISAINHKSPQRYQQRDNIVGSTEVELRNASNIAPRYGERGVDQQDRYGLYRRNSSLDVEGGGTSTGSQNRFNWGSTKVELRNAPSYNQHFGEQRLIRDHRMEQLDQRMIASYLQHCAELDVNQRQSEQQNTNLGVNCAKVSSQKPQNIMDWSSMEVELRNAPIPSKFCGEDYKHTNDQIDQQKNVFGDIKAPLQNVRESYDRQKIQDGILKDQRNNVSQSNPLSTIQIPQTQMETNNDIMTKLVSRQILGKDLPEFHGEISKWLTFQDHYNETTTSCQFTDRENIMRLRKCLKGKARDCVESLLVSSQNAKSIMAVLERRFGRPDDIVKTEIKKVKAIPSPKEDDPQSIIEFATAVQNLVVTL